jgi:lambda family phage minor tail protein L
MTEIIDTVQLDSPGGFVDLFEIPIEEGPLYFHAGLVGGASSVYFPSIDGTQINQYVAIPIELTGLEYAADGAQNRPTLTVANIIKGASPTSAGLDTTLQKEVFIKDYLTNEYFIGKKLTRRRTFVEYLVAEDAVPLNVPPSELPKATYVVDRIASENSVVVTFELASPLDVEGIKVPNRTVVGKYCSWRYQGRYQTPSRGGCAMRTKSVIDVASDVSGEALAHFTFFDAFDRPCVLESTLAAAAIEEFAGGTYSKDDIVTYSGNYYRSNTDTNNATPAPLSALWQILVSYTDYNPAATYSYTALPHYNVVRHTLNGLSMLWFPKRPVPLAEAPPTVQLTNSLYWKRIDVCGKTVNSCKVRFQYIPIDHTSTGAGVLSIPSASTDTTEKLPFGGFPGTAKFR